MINAISGFLERNKKRILVSAGVAATGYLALDYLKSKFAEIQDRAATERAAKDNLRLRFEQNQHDALLTIMALMPSLVTEIKEKFPVEQITAELQKKRLEKSSARSTTSSTFLGDSSGMNPPQSSKAELWQELKIQSLTRLFTLVYSFALLVYFTRLQLSILGRKSYIASVINMANKAHPPYTEVREKDVQINRMYLKFSWWLLNEGWLTVAERVQDAVVNVFEHLNPRADLSLPDLSELIGQVQYLIDYDDAPTSFLGSLLPEPELEGYVLLQTSPNQSTEVPRELRALLDETEDFIESQNSTEVIKRLVHAGLAVVVSKIAVLYPSPETTTVKLASVLANLTRQTTAMAAAETPFRPNEYIASMANLQELDAFSAVVYSHFDIGDVDM